MPSDQWLTRNSSAACCSCVVELEPSPATSRRPLSIAIDLDLVARAGLRRDRAVHGDALCRRGEHGDVRRRTELVDRVAGRLVARSTSAATWLPSSLTPTTNARVPTSASAIGCERDGRDVDDLLGLRRERDDVELGLRRGIGHDVRDARVVARDHVVDEASRRRQLYDLGFAAERQASVVCVLRRATWWERASRAALRPT